MVSPPFNGRGCHFPIWPDLPNALGESQLLAPVFQLGTFRIGPSTFQWRVAAFPKGLVQYTHSVDLHLCLVFFPLRRSLLLLSLSLCLRSLRARIAGISHEGLWRLRSEMGGGLCRCDLKPKSLVPPNERGKPAKIKTGALLRPGVLITPP